MSSDKMSCLTNVLFDLLIHESHIGLDLIKLKAKDLFRYLVK